MSAVMMRDMSSEDRLLVIGARDGDTVAREALGRRVGRAAYVFALQLTSDRQTALDVSQDGVARFFRHLDRFDAERPIDPWLYQIVRNRVRDQARKEGRRRVESLDALIEQGGPGPVDPSPDASVGVERAELQRRIWRAVSQLSDAQREIFVLRDHHGLSYREIAETLEIPQGTVMSRLHAARTSLRRILAAERQPRAGNDEGSDR